ncbi:hypothetical protein D9M71_104860 [compost metagenome]
MPAQLAADDIVANLIENRRRIRTGLTVHPCAPRADVAGAVHQPATKPEFLTRSQAHHVIGARRVGQFRQRLGTLPVLSQAVLQFRTLAVLCAGRREPPFQGDAEHLRRSPQECQGRRCTDLAFQVGERGYLPGGAHVHRTHSTHARQVVARVDALYIHCGCAGTRQAYPVAAILAPLHVIGHRAGDLRPRDGHGIDRDTLVDDVMGRQLHIRRRRHERGGYYSDRALIQLRAGVHSGELARLVLQASDVVVAAVIPRNLQHTIQLHRQVERIQRPYQLRLGRDRIGRGDGQRATIHRLYGACLGAAAGQIDDQPVSGLGLGITIEGDHPARHRRDPPANLTPGQHRVRHRNDVARQRNAPLGTSSERHGTVQMIGEYRPLATADGFRLAAAADSTDLHRTVAVAPRQSVVGKGGHVGVVVVRRVVVTHQGTGIARACRAARVGEAAVDDVRAGEDVIEIGGARHVRLKRNLPVGPVAHPAKDRRQVAQQRPRLGARLQVQVAGEARFLAALAIRNQLVAILRDAVQLPFVDHPRLDAAA